MDLYMRAVEPKPTPLEPLSEEEKAKGRVIANLYVKMMWKRHHVRNRDLQRKIRLKWAAIHALPTVELRREALFVDPYVPLRTRIPTLTPPLKGFHGDSRSGGDSISAIDDSSEGGAPAVSDYYVRPKKLKTAAEFGALGSAARSRRSSGADVAALTRGLEYELAAAEASAGSGGSTELQGGTAAKVLTPASNVKPGKKK